MSGDSRSVAGAAGAGALFFGALVRPEAGLAWTALGLAVGLAVAVALRSARSASGTRGVLVLAAAVFLLAVFRTPIGLDGALGTWFSPNGGLVYWNPALWLGLAGLFLDRADVRPALGVLGMACYACLPGNSGLAGLAAGLLIPGAMRSAETLRRLTSTRPLAGLAVGAAVLVVWNFLFMEQYRRNVIPRDDTVSFVDVAGNNAALFTHAFGAPMTWPASWLFAARHHIPVDRYEAALVLPPSFASSDTETIDLAAPRPTALLVGGWSEPSPCEEAACRALTVDAHLLLLQTRAASLDVTVRMTGNGTVELRVNGVGAAALPVPPALEDVRVQIGAERWRPGYNRVSIIPSAGTDVRLSRIVLRQVGGKL